MEAVDNIKHNLPGAIVSVCSSGNHVRHYCSGVADVDHNTPITAQGLWQNGRISCMFTAAIVLQLVEQGLVDLDMPLAMLSQQHHLDGGRLKVIVDLYPVLKPVTLCELLNHTSGLPSYDETLDYQDMFFRNPKKVWQAEAYLDLISGAGVHYRSGYQIPVRGVFSYGVTNYVLVGLVLEAITGRRSSQQMAELFSATGLKSTYYNAYGTLEPSLLPQMIHGYLPLSHPHAEAFSRLPVCTYNNNRELKAYDVTSAYNSNGLSGSATVSTTTDLILWLRSLMHGKILQKSFKTLFQAVPVPLDPRSRQQEQDFYGLGIYKTKTRRYGEIIWNGGNNYGYGVLVAHGIDRDITFALAVNISRSLINLNNKELVTVLLQHVLR